MKEDNYMDKYKYIKRSPSSSNGGNSPSIWRNSLSSTSSSSSPSTRLNYLNSSKSVPNIHNLNLSDSDNSDDDDDDTDDEHGDVVIEGGSGDGDVINVTDAHLDNKQLKRKYLTKNKLHEINNDEKNEILLNGANNIFRTKNINNNHNNNSNSNSNIIKEKKNPLYSSIENLGQQQQQQKRDDDNNNNNELMKMMMMLRKKRQQQQKQLQQQFQQDSYLNNSQPKLFNKENDNSKHHNNQNQQQQQRPANKQTDDDLHINKVESPSSVTHLTKNPSIMRGNLSAKPPISKKRQELTKAITEARKKLETIGWKASGLNTSKSVANLRDIGGDIRDQVMMGTPINTSMDSVRRSISLSDLSVNPSHRRILSKNNDNNRLMDKDKDKESAPLWNRVKIEKPLNRYPSHNPMRKSYSTVTLNRNNDINSSLSSSSTITGSQTAQGNQASVSKILQRSLWGPPVNLNTLTHSKSWGRLSAPPTKGYTESPILRNNSNRRLSVDHDPSDDSSSSNEERLPIARPGTPPKPKPLTRNRRIASNQTSKDNFLAIQNNSINSLAGNVNVQNRTINGNQEKKQRKTWGSNFLMQGAKSDYNLSTIGRETPNQIRSPSSNSSSYLGNAENNYYEKFDIASANPVKIALTEDLCSTIIDELNQVATFVKKIYHRSAAEGRTNLCNILVDGISKAYVSLSTVVTPSEMVSNSVGEQLSPNSTIAQLPLTNAAGQSSNPENLTQTLKLLQQYSDRLLDIVEQRMSSKTTK